MRIPGTTLLLLAAATLLATGARAQPVRMNQKAPKLNGKEWINSDPLTWEGRAGKVTIVHFWTYECINCRHNLPVYERWHKQFGLRDVAIVGIHTPEFDRERVRSNVERKVKDYGIAWPVLLDPNMDNWRRWNQQFWPAVYLVDKTGKVRYRWDGELNYGKLDGEARMAALVEQLLAE